MREAAAKAAKAAADEAADAAAAHGAALAKLAAEAEKAQVRCFGSGLVGRVRRQSGRRGCWEAGYWTSTLQTCL